MVPGGGRGRPCAAGHVLSTDHAEPLPRRRLRGDHRSMECAQVTVDEAGASLVIEWATSAGWELLDIAWDDWCGECVITLART